jgi:hypothetical protein
MFNIKVLVFVHVLFLRLSYISYNKQQMFPYTAFVDLCA